VADYPVKVVGGEANIHPSTCTCASNAAGIPSEPWSFPRNALLGRVT